MRVAIEKVEGVEEAEVSLNEGTVEIGLEKDNRVTVEKVREIIRSNGFAPKATDVRVEGEVIAREGKLALRVSGPDVVYRLFFTAGDQREANVEKLRERMGKQVVITGSVPEGSESRVVVKTVITAGT